MSETVFTEAECKALKKIHLLPFFLFPVGVLGMWMIAHPWPSDQPACVIFWQLVTSYVFFCWTSCFHECAHQTLCGSRKVSIVLGRVIGMLIYVPYTAYRESHIRHHAYLNKPTDWELWPYSDPAASKTFRRVFVWLDLVFGFVVAPFTYGRIFFHKNSPLHQPRLRAAVRFEYALIVLFWGSICAWIGYKDAWWGLLTVWVVPHWLAGIYQNGRKLTEHLGMASYDPMLGTRTVLGGNFLTRLCTFSNFDIFIHGPHHRHPRVAHDQLEQKMNDYIVEHPEADYPVYKTYWGATARMIPFMFKNPGVGMNVGAASPNEEKDNDVQNFVADVTAEVLAELDADPLHAAS